MYCTCMYTPPSLLDQVMFNHSSCRGCFGLVREVQEDQSFAHSTKSCLPPRAAAALRAVVFNVTVSNIHLF